MPNHIQLYNSRCLNFHTYTLFSLSTYLEYLTKVNVCYRRSNENYTRHIFIVFRHNHIFFHLPTKRRLISHITNSYGGTHAEPSPTTDKRSSDPPTVWKSIRTYRQDSFAEDTLLLLARTPAEVPFRLMNGQPSATRGTTLRPNAPVHTPPIIQYESCPCSG